VNVTQGTMLRDAVCNTFSPLPIVCLCTQCFVTVVAQVESYRDKSPSISLPVQQQLRSIVSFEMYIKEED